MPKSLAQNLGKMDETSWSRGGCGEPLQNQFEVSRKVRNVMSQVIWTQQEKGDGAVKGKDYYMTGFVAACGWRNPIQSLDGILLDRQFFQVQVMAESISYRCYTIQCL